MKIFASLYLFESPCKADPFEVLQEKILHFESSLAFVNVVVEILLLLGKFHKQLSLVI